MKRYLLFAGSHYYPKGGWLDFRDDFDSLESIESYIKTSEWGWYHVLDTKHGEILKEFKMHKIQLPLLANEKIRGDVNNSCGIIDS